MADSKPKDNWDKLLAITTIVSSVAVPIVIAIAANTYTMTLKDSENSIRYIEIALGVLRAEPNASTTDLRIWAVDVFKRYSPIPLSDKVGQHLLEEKLNYVNNPTYDTGTTFPASLVFKGEREQGKKVPGGVPSKPNASFHGPLLDKAVQHP